MTGTYPDGFESWPIERRDEFFAVAAELYRLEKANGARVSADGDPPSALGELPEICDVADHADYIKHAREEQPTELDVVQASALAKAAVPLRRWLVAEMIPDRTVTLLSGDGGLGKSLLAKQLAVAVAAAKDWIGTVPECGAVLYVGAEDDLGEIHRRLADITSAQGVDLAALSNLHIVPLAGKDAVLAAPHRQPGLITPTPLWGSLVRLLGRFRPKLLALDNLADIFAGNENSRPEARQFIGLLRGLAIDYDLAVLLIAHPSLSGLQSGSGTSGSTAWANSVRSRLYLDRPKTEDGDDVDNDLRVLRVMKSNYSALGAEIRLKWETGRFRLIDSGGFNKLAADAKADRVFLELTAKFQAQDRDVSPNKSSTYAPAMFSKCPDADGLSTKALAAAMDRLFAGQKIRVERLGPPSKQRCRIVVVEHSAPE